MRREYDRLVNDYLVPKHILCQNGFCVLSEPECNKMLHALVPFEYPDMYAIVDDKAIIVEHFEFDASRCTRKGMKGKREEAWLEERIENTTIDGEIHFDKADYEITLKDWQKNFENCFYSHYNKIEKYKENLRIKTSVGDRKILVGFFVENQYPPLVRIDGRTAYLLYIQTKQFAKVLRNSPNVDFVIYGCCDGQRELFFVDRESISKASNLVDLESDQVVLSHLNKNEIVMYGG